MNSPFRVSMESVVSPLLPSFFLSGAELGTWDEAAGSIRVSASTGRGSTARHASKSVYHELMERAAVNQHLSPLQSVGSSPPALSEAFAPFLPGQKLSGAYASDWRGAETTEALELFTGKVGVVPKELVWFGQKRVLGDRSVRYYPPIDTTGCASSDDLEGAVRSAIFELLEKNSLLAMWLKREVKGEIPLESLKWDRDLRLLLSVSRKSGLSPRFYDISEFKPLATVLCIARTLSGKPYYAIGAGSGFTVREALSLIFGLVPLTFLFGFAAASLNRLPFGYKNLNLVISFSAWLMLAVSPAFVGAMANRPGISLVVELNPLLFGVRLLNLFQSLSFERLSYLGIYTAALVCIGLCRGNQLRVTPVGRR